MKRKPRERLLDLVEQGAATYQLAPRTLWRWVFDAMLGDELDVLIPHDARFNTQEIEETHWRRLFASTRDSLNWRGEDMWRCGWTRLVTLDPDQFDEWLYQTHYKSVILQAKGQKA